MMKRFPFSEAENFRDLGGYPLSLTTCTNYGKFFRSDAMYDSATEKELALLKTLDIRTVIDLRSSWEAEQYPVYFQGNSNFSYHNISLTTNFNDLQDERDIPLLYLSMADLQEQIRQIFSLLANSEGAVLYHCAAGKDRTGVVSSLLLSIAGCDRADIIADYQVSRTYLVKKIAEIESDMKNVSRFFLGYSKPEFIEGFFDLLIKKYGSLDEYFEKIDIPGSDLAKIRAKLVP